MVHIQIEVDTAADFLESRGAVAQFTLKNTAHFSILV